MFGEVESVPSTGKSSNSSSSSSCADGFGGFCGVEAASFVVAFVVGAVDLGPAVPDMMID